MAGQKRIHACRLASWLVDPEDFEHEQPQISDGTMIW
jgi:hypothetical protein